MRTVRPLALERIRAGEVVGQFSVMVISERIASTFADIDAIVLNRHVAPHLHNVVL